MLGARFNQLIKGVLRRSNIRESAAIEPVIAPSITPLQILAPEQYIEPCEVMLEQGLINTLNEYADAVNKLAIEVRKEGDLLLTLGVSDEDVMKASNMAQLALSCVNIGRGRDLKGDVKKSSFSERKSNVATGMVLTKEAQRLLSGAKKHNEKAINKAVARHEQILQNINKLKLSKA